jgi:hypothetical protein
MNAILLGAACLGAFAVFVTRDPHQVESARMETARAAVVQEQPDVGSMTRTITLDPRTGEETEINVIAFVD